MGVYVKLYVESLKKGKSSLECIGVVNTGFRSPDPDIILPKDIAEKLGLYPPPEDSFQVEAHTGGGPVIVYIIPEAIEVHVVTRDRISKRVKCNVLVNPLEDEVLLSDRLTEDLGIQILYPSKGIWRFIDDPIGFERESEKY